MTKTQEKKLFWDLETSHNLAATFGLYDVTIPHGNILKERFIISGQWSWGDSKKVHTISLADFPHLFKKDRGDDYGVVKKLHEVLSEADIIIAHNGNKFDWKYFITRSAYHGLDPIAKPICIDTYLVAKKHFKFNSNSLDYIATYFGLGGKIKTSNSWWLNIINPNSPYADAVAAVKNMVRYGKKDIVLLKGIYKRMMPYMDNHPNVNLFVGGEGAQACPTCGSESLEKRGFQFTRTGKYQRFKCNSCKAWSRSGKREQGSDLR